MFRADQDGGLTPASDDQVGNWMPMAGPVSRRYRLQAAERSDPERAELELFVAEAFHRRHGARIHSFMPTLLGLYDNAGAISAVAGYRLAGREPLFLEQYLEEPVEQALGACLPGIIKREQVVEIGNFAGAGCRPARQLAALLPTFFLERGLTWAVFTATSLIRELLTGLGVPMLELRAADRRRLAGTGNGPRDDWGAYYEADPRVMAACIPDALGLSLARRRHRPGRRQGTRDPAFMNGSSG